MCNLELANTLEILSALGAPVNTQLFDFLSTGTKPVNGWYFDALMLIQATNTLDCIFGYTKLPVNMTHEMYVLNITLTSFSCEKLLKSLMSDPEQSHSLANLFNNLNQPAMNAICKKVNEKYITVDYKKADEADKNLIETCVRHGMLQNEIEKHKQEANAKKKTFIKSNNYNERGFNKRLRENSNAYENFRYWHESYPHNYDSRFMKYFQEALLEFCEKEAIWNNSAPNYCKPKQDAIQTVNLKSLSDSKRKITCEAEINSLVEDMRGKLKAQLLQHTEFELI